MAESPSRRTEIKRKRGKIFTEGEMEIIQNEVEQNFQILCSKLNNTVTNARKKSIWDNICMKVNALGVAVRTPKEVRVKWENTKKEAKKVFTNQQQERGKTGGGPAPSKVSLSVARTIDLCKDSASFKGLSGFETDFCPEEGTSTDAALPEEDASQELFESAQSQILSVYQLADTQSPPSSPILQPRPRVLQPLSPVVQIMNEPESSKVSAPIADAPVIASHIQVKENVKQAKKKRTTPEDVYEIQVKYFKGEMEKQQKEMRKLDLQIQLVVGLIIIYALYLQVKYFKGEMEKQQKEMKKLDLQIQLLEKMCGRSDESPALTLSQLYSSMF